MTSIASAPGGSGLCEGFLEVTTLACANEPQWIPEDGALVRAVLPGALKPTCPRIVREVAPSPRPR